MTVHDNYKQYTYYRYQHMIDYYYYQCVEESHYLLQAIHVFRTCRVFLKSPTHAQFTWCD